MKCSVHHARSKTNGEQRGGGTLRTFDSPWVRDDVGRYRGEREKLPKFSAVKKYGTGEPVHIQGERSRIFYFLRKGRVKISIFRDDGTEKILAIQEDDTFFDEPAAFDDRPYSTTATRCPEEGGPHSAGPCARARAEEEEGLAAQKRITHDDLVHLAGLALGSVAHILNYLERLKIIKNEEVHPCRSGSGEARAHAGCELDQRASEPVLSRDASLTLAKGRSHGPNTLLVKGGNNDS